MTTTTTPTVPGRLPVQATTAGRARRGPALLARRVLLLLHLAMGLGWLGVTSTFVVLTLWLLGNRDPATVRTGYAVHELMVEWLARPAAIGAAATGLLLALTAGRHRRPRWWLWWAPAKLALVVATVVVTVSISPAALRFAVERADTVGTPAYTDTQHALVLVAVYHVVMITAAAVLAVFRPGARFRGPGRTRRTS
jgi:hypothetical protein